MRRFIVQVEVCVYAEDAEEAAWIVDTEIFPVSAGDNPIAYMAYHANEIREEYN